MRGCWHATLCVLRSLRSGGRARCECNIGAVPALKIGLLGVRPGLVKTGGRTRSRFSNPWETRALTRVL